MKFSMDFATGWSAQVSIVTVGVNLQANDLRMAIARMKDYCPLILSGCAKWADFMTLRKTRLISSLSCFSFSCL